MIPSPKPTTAEDEDDSRIAFQDCAHFLVVTTESLADVSARLPDNQSMDVTKFCPNIVLSGSKGGAWAEGYWGELAIADDIVVPLTANCVRCKSINVDYATGAPGTDESGTVLKKLQRDRRVGAEAKYSPCFGRYVFRRKDDVGKRVGVGMRVAVTKVNEERTKFGESLPVIISDISDDYVYCYCNRMAGFVEFLRVGFCRRSFRFRTFALRASTFLLLIILHHFCWKYGFVVSPIISSFDIHVVYSTRSTLRCESRCVSRCTRSEMRLFSGAAEPQEYGYLYRSICHDVQNKIKQLILFHAAHTITILIFVISSISYSHIFLSIIYQYYIQK